MTGLKEKFEEMQGRMEIRNEIWRKKEEMNTKMNQLVDALFDEGIGIFVDWFDKFGKLLEDSLNVERACNHGTLKEYFIKNSHCPDIKISIHLNINNFHFRDVVKKEDILSLKIRGRKNGLLFDIDLNRFPENEDSLLAELKCLCERANLTDFRDCPIKWFK